MVSIVWEMKALCSVSCPPPNNCWEPVDFTQPNLCLASSVNPNNFENHLAIHEASAFMIAIFLFVGGLALGVLCGFLPLCCNFLSNRRRRNKFKASKYSTRSPFVHRTARDFPEPLILPNLRGFSA